MSQARAPKPDIDLMKFQTKVEDAVMKVGRAPSMDSYWKLHVSKSTAKANPVHPKEKIIAGTTLSEQSLNRLTKSAPEITKSIIQSTRPAIELIESHSTAQD